jgi:hypothetical protein
VAGSSGRGLAEKRPEAHKDIDASLPIVIIEAMACGTPMAVRRGVLPKVVAGMTDLAVLARGRD